MSVERSNQDENKIEPRSIAELWEESDRINAEIKKKPWKYPIQYLKMLLFEGIPQKTDKK